jgi:hypothetical protein
LSVIAVAGEIGLQVVGLALIVANFIVQEYWLEHAPVTLVPTTSGASVVGRF